MQNEWLSGDGGYSKYDMINVTKAINPTSLSALHLKVWTNSKYLSSKALNFLGLMLGVIESENFQVGSET